VKISVFPTDQAAASAVAARIASALESNPRLVLGLPTGRTPVRVYRELAALAAAGRVSFAQASSFNLDEFIGVAPGVSGGFRAFMDRHLFDLVDLPRERIHFLDGTARDLDAECARYEAAIAAAGGLDLVVLGIGVNGHIGFNEPGPALRARTHRVVLRAETRRANAALFGGDPDRVPREALSMGMATILLARRIVLLATGRTKAACVERMVNGPITTEVPASFLLLHRDVELALDRAAASALDGK
jgi:glucosamine-6-phosphate deaminase